jgi:hypothetical protein
MGQGGCWYSFLDLLTGWTPAKLVATQLVLFLFVYGRLGSYFDRREHRFHRWATSILPPGGLEDFHADSWSKIRKVCWAWHGKKIMEELNSSFKLLLTVGFPVAVAAGFAVAAVLALQGIQGNVCQSGMTSTWWVLVATYAWMGGCALWALQVKSRFSKLVLEVDENL